jgi:hypothetical protein
MGRPKRKFATVREIPPEYCSTIWMSESGDQGFWLFVVDWLNRALAAGAVDREAAEWLGGQIKNLQEFMNNPPEHDLWPFEIEGWSFVWHLLAPHQEYPKWRVMLDCRPDSLDDLPVVGTKVRFYDEGDFAPDPLLVLVPALVHIAIDGLICTIKQCEVPSCRIWFLGKNDTSTRFCPDHDSDDYRKDDPERKERVKARSEAYREKEKEDEKTAWNQVGKKGDHKGPSHRAQK